MLRVLKDDIADASGRNNDGDSLSWYPMSMDAPPTPYQGR